MKNSRRTSRVWLWLRWTSRGIFVLICVACMGLMFDSYYEMRGFTLREDVKGASRLFEVRSFKGTLGFEISRSDWDQAQAVDQPHQFSLWKIHASRGDALANPNSLPFNWVEFGSHPFGFESTSNRSGSPIITQTNIWLPWWFVFLLTLIPLAFIYQSMQRRKRISRGLCPKCGYDLIESPDRCPECGAMAKSSVKFA